MGQSSRRNWHPTLSKIDSEIKNTPPQNKVETDQSTSTELAAKAKPCVHCPHYLTCSITMRKTGVGGKACGPPLRLDRGRVTVIPGCVTYLEHPSCGVASCCCCCAVRWWWAQEGPGPTEQLQFFPGSTTGRLPAGAPQLHTVKVSCPVSGSSANLPLHSTLSPAEQPIRRQSGCWADWPTNQ